MPNEMLKSMELAHISNDKAAAGRTKKGVLIAIAICFAMLGVAYCAFPEQSIVGSVIKIFPVGAVIVLSFLWCILDSIINDYSLLNNRLFFIVVFILFLFILPLGLIIYLWLKGV